MEPVDRRSDEARKASGTGVATPFGRKPRSTASVAAGAGLEFAVSIILFVFLGQWLDRRLGMAPVFLLGCLFVGAGGSFYSMYRKLTAAQKREADQIAADRAAQAEGGSTPPAAR